MKQQPDEPSVWPDELGAGYQISLGSYGGLDDRYKRRKRKNQVGFQLKQRPSAKKTSK